MPRTRPSARNASLPYPVALGEILDLPSVPVRRYDRKWLGLFAASSGGNRILSRVWKSAPRVRSVAGGRLSFLILSSSPYRGLSGWSESLWPALGNGPSPRGSSPEVRGATCRNGHGPFVSRGCSS